MNKLIEIKRLAMFKPTPIRIDYLVNYVNDYNKKDTILNMAYFMQKEMPVRLAHRVVQLNSMPNEMANDIIIKNINELYQESLFRIKDMKISNFSDAMKLSNVLDDIKKNHKDVAYDISISLQYLKENMEKKPFNIDDFLNRFYNSRIGIRTLIGNYTSICNEKNGIVDNECNPYKIIKKCIDDCKELSMINYAYSPNVSLIGNSEYTFPYISAHLYYIVSELLKNSMTAIIKNSTTDYLKDPITIMISEGEDDIIIKISDKGKGFKRSEINNIFKYSYTTSSLSHSELKSFSMSGYGHGLPLARLYAKYFNGDLQIIPYYGFGTDAIVYINKIGNQPEKIY